MMWRPGSNRFFDGLEKSLDGSDQVSDQKFLKSIIPKTVQSSNCTEIFLRRKQLIESFLETRGATTLLPLIPCENLKEKWLGNSMEEISICDRIRIQIGVRIALLFGVSAEIAAALTVLAAGIWIWSSKVEALPQVPSHPKELSIPQCCDCSNSIRRRGWGRE